MLPELAMPLPVLPHALPRRSSRWRLPRRARPTEASERLRGVEEPLRALSFPEEQGARCLALVKGSVRGARRCALRVHSECLLGDALGSLRCQCGSQLSALAPTEWCPRGQEASSGRCWAAGSTPAPCCSTCRARRARASACGRS